MDDVRCLWVVFRYSDGQMGSHPDGISSGWDRVRVGSRPGGITSRWDHVRVGSDPGGIGCALGQGGITIGSLFCLFARVILRANFPIKFSSTQRRTLLEP